MEGNLTDRDFYRAQRLTVGSGCSTRETRQPMLGCYLGPSPFQTPLLASAWLLRGTIRLRDSGRRDLRELRRLCQQGRADRIGDGTWAATSLAPHWSAECRVDWQPLAVG